MKLQHNNILTCLLLQCKCHKHVTEKVICVQSKRASESASREGSPDAKEGTKDKGGKKGTKAEETGDEDEQAERSTEDEEVGDKGERQPKNKSEDQSGANKADKDDDQVGACVSLLSTAWSKQSCASSLWSMLSATPVSNTVSHCKFV